jgi:ferredoxin-NADP reductase
MAAGMAAGIILAFSAGSLLLPLTTRGEEARTRTALSLTLAGAGLGAVAGLILARRRPAPTREAPSAGQAGWKDWRPFRVVRRVKESEEITSFHLEPVDGLPIDPFLPGQFLTFRLQIPGQAHAAIRTYSLSDYAGSGGHAGGHYRISVKREPAPDGLDVPPGLVSSFLHDQVPEGSVIDVRPPSGSFVLDLALSTPAVLISNGVGITPMMAMVKAATLANPNRRLLFVHGSRNGRFHAFREEVAQLQAGNPSLTVHHAYSRPEPADEGHYHSKGYVDVSLIRSLVPAEADYFLCGSPPFLEALRSGLRQDGIAEGKVHFEMFTRAAAPTADAGTQGAGTQGAGTQDVASQAEVTFARSHRSAAWNGEAESLLAFAEAQGLQPPFSCRAGVCGTCMCRLLEGEVSYEVPPTATVAEGSVLICISRPRSKTLTLDL